MALSTGRFVVSLDFELDWGVRDQPFRDRYRPNLLGARAAIPRILAAFSKRQIHATWATVGLLFHRSRDELLANAPSLLPLYADARLRPQADFRRLGSDEGADPLHFAPSLIERILATPHQEVGTHTWSHFYCLEPGQNAECFRADLAAALRAAAPYGVTLKSIVFPRNQVNHAYLRICQELGFTCYRGNPNRWRYAAVPAAHDGRMRRAARLIDAYVGHPRANTGMIEPTSRIPMDIPASRFLRPVSGNAPGATAFRLHRIKSEMHFAARMGRLYHLWWHPHNFGARLEANMRLLEDILEHFSRLSDSFGMRSVSMAELAAECSS